MIWPWPIWTGVRKAHMAKKPLMGKAHRAKKPTKILWYRANPWAFFLEKNIHYEYKKNGNN